MQETWDTGSIPGSGRLPGGGHGNPLQYSCLGNPMDQGAWRATVHGVTKNWTRLSNWSCSRSLAAIGLWAPEDYILPSVMGPSPPCPLCGRDRSIFPEWINELMNDGSSYPPKQKAMQLPLLLELANGREGRSGFNVCFWKSSHLAVFLCSSSNISNETHHRKCFLGVTQLW